jgi:hypothetical protein
LSLPENDERRRGQNKESSQRRATVMRTNMIHCLLETPGEMPTTDLLIKDHEMEENLLPQTVELPSEKKNYCRLLTGKFPMTSGLQKKRKISIP